MLFARAAIVGMGLIGGSLALAAKRAGLVGEVIGVARSDRTLERSLARGAADRVTKDPLEAVAGADLVYLATPVQHIIDLLPQLGDHLLEGALVTDAGSTKQQIMAAGAGLPARVAFVGGHPMAGSEQAGIEAAHPDLFLGCSYFLTPRGEADQSHLRKLQALVEGVGGRPLVVPAQSHDSLVAASSHLPHLLAWCLCAVASELAAPREFSDFTAGAWRDTTRIADSSPELWADILLTNSAEICRRAESYQTSLAQYRDALERGDRQQLLSLLRAGREFHQEAKKE